MAGNGIIEVSDASFDQDVLKSEQPFLIDFWAPWCGPCKAIAPIVDAISAEFNGKLRVGKMNIDNNGATPSRYGVRGIPTLLLFKGGQVKEQVVGYKSKEELTDIVKNHLG